MLYSPSRLNAFEQCPRKFRYRYVDEVPPEPWQSIESFMGGVVHLALEELYKKVRDGKRAPALEETVADFQRFWAQEWSRAKEEGRPVRVIKTNGETAEDYRLTGWRCVESYWRAQRPFDRGEVLGLEHQVEFTLAENGIRIQGFIDRLMRRPAKDGKGEVLEIHDYKTGRPPRSSAELEKERQLPLYQIGVEEQFPGARGVVLVWHFLREGREIKRLRGAGQQEALRRETAALVERIEAEKAWPARVGPLCRWCEYQGLCPEYQKSK